MSKVIKVLFIPVSSTFGVGEYSRSLIIANELSFRYPNFKISFLLNQHADCSKTCPFETHLSNGSATKDSKAVTKVLTELSPDLVIFDCAGRAKHFKLAKQLGAKVIFISQHQKKRQRGLGFRRLFNIDIHWVAQPEFAIEPINLITRTKLRLFNKTPPKLIGAVFKSPNNEKVKKLFEEYNLERGEYLVFNAGSGGHKSGLSFASDIYYQSAKEVAKKYQIRCLVIFGANYPKELPSSKDVRCIRALDNDSFMGLLVNSKGAAISGGDTLLQAIDIEIPCVVAAVSKDQPARIMRCRHIKNMITANLSVQDLTNQVANLIEAVEGKTTNRKEFSLSRGLELVLSDIKQILNL